MDNLRFFLGMEVIPTPKGLFLSQHKYVRELLSTTFMDNAKEVLTLMSTIAKLTNTDASEHTDGVDEKGLELSLITQFLSKFATIFSISNFW